MPAPDPALTRRGLLAAAGASTLSLALGRAGTAAAGPLSGGLVPELTTVTDTGMAAWWRTGAPADTTLRIWPVRGDGARELRLERSATVHVAALDDLRPGTTYRYELRSGGRALPRSPVNPGVFTTLAPPSGRLLATIALLNDLHVGERCSGTITNVGGSSIPPCFTGDDYAYRMSAAAVDELRAREDVDLVVANGDLTDRGRAREVARAMALLRTLPAAVAVTRGNHDRRLHGPQGCEPDGDCLRAAAFPEREPGDHLTNWVERIGDRVAVVGLDSNDPDTGDGRLDVGDTLPWLDHQLGVLGAEGRIVLVAFHHPVTLESTVTHPPPLLSGVRADRGGAAALAILARHRSHVRLVLHGHTHRNFVSHDPLCGPRMRFLENGAIKEFPAGYALLRVHEDGIVRTFHRPSSPFAREWVATTARQIWGQHANVTRGTLGSRAFVHRF